MVDFRNYSHQFVFFVELGVIPDEWWVTNHVDDRISLETKQTDTCDQTVSVRIVTIHLR